MLTFITMLVLAAILIYAISFIISAGGPFIIAILVAIVVYLAICFWLLGRK